MQLIRNAVLCVCAMLLAGAAQAHASAHLSFTGPDVDLHVDMNGSGATQGESLFFVAIDPGQTIDEQFSYTVTLSDEALPAERTWSFCTLVVFHSDCGPEATGGEQAAASILIARDMRSADGRIQDRVIFDHFYSVPGTTRTFSGTIDYIATNTSDVERLYETVPVLGAVFVDASAVFEPPPLVTSMLGLFALVLSMRRSRSPIPALVTRATKPSGTVRSGADFVLSPSSSPAPMANAPILTSSRSMRNSVPGVLLA